MSLPKWEDQQSMKSWTFHKLDEYFEASIRAHNNAAPDELPAEWIHTSAIEAARRGNVQPLRKLYPQIAEFILPPERGRGKYSRKQGGDRAVPDAANIVPIIRQIWRHELGKQNQRGGHGPSAIDIAAAYFGVDRDDVANLIKRGGSGRR